MRTLKLLAAGVAALGLAASAAQADPVTQSKFAATYGNAGLGGSFVFLNSGGQNPLAFDDDWTTEWFPSDVVFDARFGGAQYTNAGDWNGSDYVFEFGFPDTSTYGERFFAPGGALTSFDFLVWNYSAACGACASLGPVDATFAVTRFDGHRGVGPVLYSTGVVIPLTDTYAWTHITIDNLNLTQGDQYVAFLTVADLSGGHGGIPEPASWALMIAGFGGLGAMARRRRTAAG